MPEPRPTWCARADKCKEEGGLHEWFNLTLPACATMLDMAYPQEPRRSGAHITGVLHAFQVVCRGRGKGARRALP